MTVVSLASVALLASCGSTSSKKTEIEFFTQKKETLGITKEIAKDEKDTSCSCNIHHRLFCYKYAKKRRKKLQGYI